MPCPKCGRIYCDHSAAERGQTQDEMFKDMQRDAEDAQRREKAAKEKELPKKT